MKKLIIAALLFMGVVCAKAQVQNPYLDENGAVRLETEEMKKDTLLKVEHRSDDIVWSRIVYRVIDMRYKQNYQLYFPTNSDDPQYRSLFKVILDAIVDGMPIYSKSESSPDFKPYLQFGAMTRDAVPGLLNTDKDGYGTGDIATDEYMLINYDSVADMMRFNNIYYKQFVRNQLKYMLQEVVFFDKHYSRLYSKIIAIAPMNSDKDGIEGMSVTEALYQEVMFWVVFDKLRPYMATQYMIPQANDTRRVTFEQFFAEKLYTSYLIGDSNMYDRMFTEYAEKAAKRAPANAGVAADEDLAVNEEEVAAEGPSKEEQEYKARLEKELKREQQRVQDELMTFELNLWEY